MSNKKIKHNSANSKIKRSSKTDFLVESEKIVVSFAYLTRNKKYNFEKMDQKEATLWRSQLLARLIELTQKTWVKWLSMPKKSGFESISCKEVSFSPNGYKPTDEEKYFVLRFFQQNGRIIGFKQGDTSVFQIVGIDTDYSAYDHG